jgi:signal transduction histidine kinase
MIEDGSARWADGAGLGVPLTRQLLTRMGGSIEVVSEVGVGSLFRLRLPAAEA